MKSTLRNSFTLFMVLNFFTLLSGANERFRPLTETAYDHLLQTGKQTAKHQTLAKVRDGCELAYLNEKRILADFPALRKLSRAQLAEWVLDQYCYMSVEQTKLNGIRQTTLNLNLNQTKKGVRQKGWRRADTMPAFYNNEFVGWADVKGSGLPTDDPGLEEQLRSFNQAMNLNDNEQVNSLNALRTSAHSDGLLTLGEGTAEVTRQTAAQMTFDLLNAEQNTAVQNAIKLPLETVETYFIIALPLDILKDNGGHVRAALYGRQPHFGRVDYGYPAPKEAYQSFQSSNQYTYGYTAVDFGAIWITHPLLKNRFGPSIPGQKFDTQVNSLPWARGHETARQFTNGNRFAVYSHLNEMLGEDFIRLWQNSSYPTDESPSTWIRTAEAFRLALIEGNQQAAQVNLNTLMTNQTVFMPEFIRTLLIETIIKPYGKVFAGDLMAQFDKNGLNDHVCLTLLTKARP